MNKIESNRAILRSFVSSDFESLKSMLMNEEVMSFTGFRNAQTEASSRELLDKWINDDFVWAAINKETNYFIGWFMLKETISKDYPEIGFMLDKSYWNQGFATEIALRLIKYAKNELGVSKVIASTDVDNIASVKVLQKIGMRPSDTFPSRDNIIYYDIRCC